MDRETKKALTEFKELCHGNNMRDNSQKVYDSDTVVGEEIEVHGMKGIAMNNRRTYDKYIYDFMFSNQETLVQLIPFVDEVRKQTGRGMCVLEFGPVSDKSTITATGESTQRAFQSLVNRCKDLCVLEELYIAFVEASDRAPGENLIEPRGINQDYGIDDFKQFKYRLDGRVDDQVDTDSSTSHNHQIEIKEDASEIDVDVDFETKMYQLSSDDGNDDVARVMSYRPNDETVTVVLQLPDSSIGTIEYDVPESTDSTFEKFVDTAVNNLGSKSVDVTLDTIELLEGASVPVGQNGDTWFVETNRSIDVDKEEDYDKDDEFINFVSVITIIICTCMLIAIVGSLLFRFFF